MKVRSLVFDVDFLKNVEDTFLEKLLYLKEPIPLNIKDVAAHRRHLLLLRARFGFRLF